MGRGLSTLRTQIGVLKAKPRGLGDIGSSLAGIWARLSTENRTGVRQQVWELRGHVTTGPEAQGRAPEGRALTRVRLALVAAAITALPPTKWRSGCRDHPGVLNTASGRMWGAFGLGLKVLCP